MVLDFWGSVFWNARWINIFGVALRMQDGSRLGVGVLECMMVLDFQSCFGMQDSSRFLEIVLETKMVQDFEGCFGKHDRSDFRGIFWMQDIMYQEFLSKFLTYDGSRFWGLFLKARWI